MELKDEHLFSEINDASLAPEMNAVYGTAPVWIGAHYPKTSCKELELYVFTNKDPYRIYRDFIAHDVERDGRVLDIGSASGAQARLLSRYFSEVVCVEDSLPRLAFARKYNSAENIEYLEGRFPTEAVKGTFDYIFCVSVLYQNNGASVKIVSAAHSMLRPGGKLFIYNPNSTEADIADWGLRVEKWVAAHEEPMVHNDRIVVLA